MWVMDVSETPGPLLRPGPPPLTHLPPRNVRVCGLPTGGPLDEDVVRELALILASAFLRRQRIERLREEPESPPENQLDTSPVQSLHGQ